MKSGGLSFQIVAFFIREYGDRSKTVASPSVKKSLFLLSKRVVFLAEIGDSDSNEGDEHLGWSGVEAAYIDEEMEAEVVNQKIDTYNDYVAVKLMPAAQRRLGEGDVFVEPETREEGDREDNAESGNVGRDGDRTDMNHLVAEDKVVNKEVKNPVEDHVGRAAKTIAKELRRHHF